MKDLLKCRILNEIHRLASDISIDVINPYYKARRIEWLSEILLDATDPGRCNYQKTINEFIRWLDESDKTYYQRLLTN